jgi:GNAT superfamily N-acetyltransferase
MTRGAARSSGGLTVSEVVAARLPWTSRVLVEWYGQAPLEAQIGTSLATELSRVGDEGFARGYRDAVGVNIDADLTSWSNRVIALDDQAGWAMTGIRFRGLDVSAPFVDVIACTAAPTAAGILQVASQVSEAYAAFTPLCTRFAVSDADAFQQVVLGAHGFGPHTGIDRHIVAGLVHRLRTAPRVATYDRVQLENGDPATLAAQAQSIYSDLAGRDPATTLWATPEDVESLTECADAGLLFEVAVDGRPAGVAAALREDAHGMRGFVVQEIVLDSAYRGRGFGPAVLQRLADHVPDDGRDVLWGSIHPDNVSSLRNAFRVGRRTVGAHAWVTPPGLPGMSP